MKAFEQGQKDFWLGQTENPFNTHTTKWKEWERGFNKSYFENLERKQNEETEN